MDSVTAEHVPQGTTSSAPGSTAFASAIAEALRAVLPSGRVTTDPSVLESFSSDAATGFPSGTPAVLVRPRSVDEVSATMRIAAEQGTPVVPQGARTGLSGGANAVPGCVLLNLSAMNRILDIDAVNGTATVEAGVINLDLKQALRPHGLAYPPDPGSVAISTIGGNIATNAGGLCCVKYGVTRDYVRELTVVLADGTITRLGRRTKKGVAGLDLAGLMVGSEGTLGVIVEATVTVVPLLPPPLTAVASFSDITAAATTVTEFMATGAQPCLMELLDGPTVAMLNDYGDFGLDASVGALLLVQSDGAGSHEQAVADTEAFGELAERCGAVDVAVSDSSADNDVLIATRRAVHPAMEHYARAHGGGQLLDDVCVPRRVLAEFFQGIEAIAEETGLVITTIAHAGDGNTHPAIFYDLEDAEETARAERAFAEIMRLGLSLGGTITGEHGVGRLKREWLRRELDAGARHLHAAIKRAVDPAGLMNPGSVIDGSMIDD